MRPITLLSTAFAATFLAACLEPPEDDDVPPERYYGDPSIDPAAAPHVEDVPEFAANVARFTTSAAYLRGFADGEPVWYWSIDGANASFIAPAYEIIGKDGMPIGRAIIDVIPEDAGYTPWWRMVEVHVTDAYDGERIWSRDAIDAGIRAGILNTPVATERVVNGPVALRNMRVPVTAEPGDDVPPKWIWYRNHRVHWVLFDEVMTLPVEVREMPAYPVYVFQRIDEPAPLYEFKTGIDLNGDGVLDASNNVFASGLDGPRYSPLWYPAFVRVVPEYESVDTSSTTPVVVGIDAEDELIDPDTNQILSPMVVPPLDVQRTTLVNCPIQRTKGAL
jgi:hypothetical protein